MKAILFVGDGMADRPLKELNWKTPLEAANKPTLNKIAKDGICGIIDPISPGTPPGSDTATLALLGYDALKVYTGRGALEAMGCGMKVSLGDVAFRCNFATVNESMSVLDRRAGRIENEDAAKLTESLQEVRLKKSLDASFLLKNTVQHRAVLVIRGPKLSANVSNSDPGKVGERVTEIKPLNNSSAAKRTARILNELTLKFHEVLKGHSVNGERVKRGLLPANALLFRGAGTVPAIKSLWELYGVKATCVAAMPLIRGTCKAAGMKLVDVKGATGTPQTDFMAKAKAALQALEDSDLVFLHMKAPDAASHDGNIKQKIELIEKIDAMAEYILQKIDVKTTYIAVTADHTTSSLTKNHEGDPVPVAISGPHIRVDDVEEFNERACAKGGLHRIRGMDLMPILMNLIGKGRKFGA
ncbi:MAG: 2,3-bisphosphoglycerate-independent phosphoglycerate mutase [Candidatus Bathycorpusculaceae bacterium]